MIRFLGFATILALIRLVWGLGALESNDGKYARSAWEMRIGADFARQAKEREGWLSGPERYLGVKLGRMGEPQRNALLASGYLTNVWITISNTWTISPNRSSNEDLEPVIHDAVPDNPFIPFRLVYSLESNDTSVCVGIECRTQDVARIRKALEKY